MKKYFLPLLCLLVITLPTPARANIEGVYKVIIQKQQEKKSTRWTLADWLSTKKKMALMDQWLALNTKTAAFEARLGGMNGNVEQINNGQAAQEKSVSRYETELLVKMIGIGAESGRPSQSLKSTSAELQLMVLGSSLQSTHLRGFYGQRKLEWDGVSDFKGAYHGGVLTLYLFDFLGTDVRYQKNSREKGENQTYEYESEAVTFGAFFDIAFLRVGAKFYKENFILRQNSLFQMQIKNEATMLSASLFF